MMLAVALLFAQFQIVAPVLSADDATSVASASSQPDTTRLKTPDLSASDANAATHTAAEKTTESSSNTRHANLSSSFSADNTSQGKQPATFTAISLDPGQKSSFSTIRIPDPAPAKPYQIREVETVPSRRAWMVLSLAEHGAATFDAYATRQAVISGAVEENPLVRPFAHSPGVYAALQVGPVFFDLLARHMQRSQYNIVRRTWWLPQSLSTATSIFSGAHDLNVASRLKH
jgi:hypothetical protein